METVIDLGTKFNTEIDEGMKDLIARQKILKAKLVRQSKSKNSHMTHAVEKYLKLVIDHDWEGLNKFLNKDIKKWQNQKESKKEESNELIKKSEEVLYRLRNQLTEIWQNNEN